MMREKYSYYEYSVMPLENSSGYIYEIYTDDLDYKNWRRTDVLRESDECFDTKLQAKCAAIGHINLLENGEG